MRAEEELSHLHKGKGGESFSAALIKTLNYCKDSDDITLKKLEDDIWYECRKRKRSGWSSCYGLVDHLSFHSNFCTEGTPDQHFLSWAFPLLESNMDNKEMRKLFFVLKEYEQKNEQKKQEMIAEREREKERREASAKRGFLERCFE
jgi:hypothetical protein